jgi:phosphoribosyl-dephospho-CoA transferase
MPNSVHTLLRLGDVNALVWDDPPPPWVTASLDRAPWVVVRRPPLRGDLYPVGIRGSTRAERAPAWLPFPAIAAAVTPQMLAPALGDVDTIMRHHGHATRWGPTGSVAFELATQLPCVSPTSDLDLALFAPTPIARHAAAALLADLPARADVLLETPHGAVSLAEYASGAPTMMLRSPLGPRLVADPW